MMIDDTHVSHVTESHQVNMPYVYDRGLALHAQCLLPPHRQNLEDHPDRKWVTLVVSPLFAGWWFQTFLFFHSVGNVIIPTDFQSIIFQRGRAQPPTSLGLSNYVIIYHIIYHIIYQPICVQHP